MGDVYNSNKILVSKYDVLNLAGRYIQYLEELLKDNGIANNFCRKTALENIRFLRKLSRPEEEPPAVSLAQSKIKDFALMAVFCFFFFW